jgi:hypothetical protein
MDSQTKSAGGWGLKDINIFSKALAAKGVFRIISTEDIW